MKSIRMLDIIHYSNSKKCFNRKAELKSWVVNEYKWAYCFNQDGCSSGKLLKIEIIQWYEIWYGNNEMEWRMLLKLILLQMRTKCSNSRIAFWWELLVNRVILPISLSTLKRIFNFTRCVMGMSFHRQLLPTSPGGIWRTLFAARLVFGKTTVWTAALFHENSASLYVLIA